MVRVGMGYDVHKLTEGRNLILGGVKIPWELGLLGHSGISEDISRIQIRSIKESQASCYCRKWELY